MDYQQQLGYTVEGPRIGLPKKEEQEKDNSGKIMTRFVNCVD